MSNMKKIAIDTSSLQSGHAVRGIGVNTGELIKAIDKINDREVEVAAVDFKKTDLSKYDLAHYQYFHPFFLTLPLKKKTKILITIHDLIYLIYPEAYPPGIKGRLRFLLQKYLINQVDGIITISETSKKDIVRFLGVPANKIHVIYLAPKEIFKKVENDKLKMEIKKKYRLPDTFVLNVGGVNYNKNLITLAAACRKVDTPLVLVGKSTTGENFDRNHPENRPFAEFLDKYGNDQNIRRLGFVQDEELNIIYNLATIYCQPSYYEGFGLGVLEAQATGCPVIASDIGAHKEIADESVIFFNPLSTNDLGGKINYLFKNADLRVRLSKDGLNNAKNFNWQKTANETLKIYKQILARA